MRVHDLKEQASRWNSEIKRQNVERLADLVELLYQDVEVIETRLYANREELRDLAFLNDALVGDGVQLLLNVKVFQQVVFGSLKDQMAFSSSEQNRVIELIGEICAILDAPISNSVPQLKKTLYQLQMIAN